jgi:hypothetical protein
MRIGAIPEIEKVPGTGKERVSWWLEWENPLPRWFDARLIRDAGCGRNQVHAPLGDNDAEG